MRSAQTLEAAKIPDTVTVVHNDFGPLTIARLATLFGDARTLRNEEAALILLPMRIDMPAPRRWGLAALLLLGIIAWAPALYPGYWQGLEGFVPVFNVAHGAPLAADGDNTGSWRGTGSGAFLLAQPLLWLGLAPTAAVRFGFVGCFIGGSLGIYFWVRQFFDDRTAGLAGLVYLFLPTFLATVYVRAAWPTRRSWPRCPWVWQGWPSMCASAAWSAPPLACSASSGCGVPRRGWPSSHRCCCFATHYG